MYSLAVSAIDPPSHSNPSFKLVLYVIGGDYTAYIKVRARTTMHIHQLYRHDLKRESLMAVAKFILLTL